MVSIASNTWQDSTDILLAIFGRGGGGAFYSGGPSSNPAETYSFFCKICVEKEQK